MVEKTVVNEEAMEPQMIKAVAKTPSGTYQVSLELNSIQHQLILETGLALLLASGAMAGAPILMKIPVEQVDDSNDEASIIVPGTDAVN